MRKSNRLTIDQVSLRSVRHPRAKIAFPALTFHRIDPEKAGHRNKYGKQSDLDN
jgi:hypothetical protein